MGNVFFSKAKSISIALAALCGTIAISGCEFNKYEVSEKLKSKTLGLTDNLNKGSFRVTEVIPGDESATVKWNSVSGAKGYTVQGENLDAEDDGEDLVSPVVTGTSYEVKGLVAGKTYSFKVNYTKSGKVTQTPNKISVKPFKKIVVEVAPRDGGVFVSWNPAPGIDEYGLAYRIGTSGAWKEVDGAIEDTSANVKNLKNGTSYYFQVSARNDMGERHYVSKAVKPSGTVAPSPSAPSNFRAIAAASDIVLSWDAITGTDVSYRILRSKTSSSGLDFEEISIVRAPAVTYSDIAVMKGVLHYYRIFAVKGTSPSMTYAPANAQVVSGAAPVAATFFRCSNCTNDVMPNMDGMGQANLTWTASTTPAVKYTLYYGDKSDAINSVYDGCKEVSGTS